jgi:hypothetical protein
MVGILLITSDILLENIQWPSSKMLKGAHTSGDVFAAVYPALPRVNLYASHYLPVNEKSRGLHFTTSLSDWEAKDA